MLDVGSLQLQNLATGAIVDLHPSPDFHIDSVFVKQTQPSVMGGIHTMRMAQQGINCSLPLTLVSSNDKSILESWWLNQVNLSLLFRTIGQAINGRIINTMQPFPVFSAITGRFEGVLMFRTIAANATFYNSSGLFIVDQSGLDSFDRIG